MSETRRRRPLSAGAHVTLVVALIGFSAALYLRSLPRVGELPNNDYYWVLNQITTDDGVSFSPQRWLSLKSNEHTVLLPAVAYVVNIWLSGGDNRALSAFSLLLLAVVFVLLFDLLVRRTDWPLAVRAVAGLALGLLVFAPTTSHNVVMGFSGTMWFMANAFAMAAIVAFARRAEGRPLWPVVLLGVCSSLSYSTGLFVWPSLLLGAWLLRARRRDFFAFAVSGALLVGYSIALLQPVPGHPPANTTGWPELCVYLGGYLGALFTFDALIAAVLGWSAIAAGALLLVALLRAGSDSRRLVVPWIVIQSYVLLNGLASAVFRSGLREGPGLSRYASLPTLFWASLVAMVFLLCQRHGLLESDGKMARTALTGLFVLLVAAPAVPLYRRGLPILHDLLDRAAYQPVAAQALRLGIHDDDMLGHVTSFPEEIWDVYGFLKKARHVPFRSTAPAKPIAPRTFDGHSPKVQGRLEILKAVDRRYARADGWALAPGDSIAEVALIDAEGTVRGRAFGGLPRPDVAQSLGPAARASGWSGYVEIDRAGGQELRAFARPAGDTAFYRLEGGLPLPAPGAVRSP